MKRNHRRAKQNNPRPPVEPAVAGRKPKTVRFAELTRHFGRPEVVTLWTEPEKDPEFSRAIEQNRVLTVAQTIVGTRADFGLVGFHQKRNALYFVFPRPLGYASGTKVIGIQYEQVSQPKATGPLHVPKPARARYQPAPKMRQEKKKAPPEPQSFQVRLRITATIEIPMTVEAFSKREARDKGVASISQPDLDFSAARLQKRVVEVVKLQG